MRPPIALPAASGAGAERRPPAPGRRGFATASASRYGARSFEAHRRTGGAGASSGGTVAEVKAEIAANVWQVVVEVGASVSEGDELIILESMKMEIPVTAPCDGTVAELRVKPEDQVQEGDVLAVIG